MKKLIQAFFITLVLFFSSHSFAQNIKQDTIKAREYLEKAKELSKKKSLDSALVYFNKSQRIYEKHELYEQQLKIKIVIARHYGNARKLDLAEQEFKAIIELARKKLPKASPIELEALNFLGAVYSAQNKTKESFKVLREALTLNETDTQPNKYSINTLKQIANTYFFIPNYDSAFYYFQKQLEQTQLFYGTNTKETALVLGNIGTVYYSLRNFEKAIEYLQKAIPIMEKTAQGSTSLANQYNSLAGIYYALDRYVSALQYIEKGQQMIAKQHGAENIKNATFFNNMGACYERIGNHEQALEQYQKSLNIRKKYHGKYNKNFIANYHNIAVLLTHSSLNNQALEYSQKAVYLIDSLKLNKSNHLDVFFTQANIHTSLKLFEKSHILFDNIEKILESMPKQDDYKWANFYHSKSILLREEYKTDSALIYLNKALVLFKKLKNKSKIGGIYNQIARNYIIQKDYEKALENAQLALETATQVFGNLHLTTSFEHQLLAEVYALEKKYKKSLEHYEQAIKIAKTLKSLPHLIEYSAEKNIVYYKHTNNAIKALQNSLSIDSLILEKYKQTVNEGDKVSSSKLYKVLNSNAMLFCWELIQKNTSTDSLAKLQSLGFYFAERNKSNILYANIQEVQGKSFADIPDTLIKLEKELKIKSNYYQKQFYAKQDSASKLYFQDKLFESNRKYETLVKNLEQNYPKYYQLKYKQNIIEPKEIQAKLPENTTLVEYAFGTENLHIFVISKEKFEWVKVAVDSSFKERVLDYVGSIRNGQKKKFIALSYELYQTLILPIAKHLPKNQELLIIPDGVLHLLPFETLLQEKPSSEKIVYTELNYLIREYAIAYHSSATLAFAEYFSAKNKGQNFIAFAPVFSEEDTKGYVLEVNRAIIAGGKLKPLPNTEREVEKIARLFEKKGFQGKAYLHDKALEDSFKNNIQDYAFIHLATHGVIKDNLKLSYIAFHQPDSANFAQEKVDKEDGILYAGEIFNLKLNAELLVLSACETGVGEVIEGEGIMSLIRAFTYAGAKSIIYSLWQVSDKKTADLMIGFYSNLLEKDQSYTQALRSAKLKMLTSVKTASPAWWAGFILQGI